MTKEIAPGLFVETVGDILESGSAAPAPRTFTVPVLDGWPTTWPGEGIFFDFPEEEYHNVPAGSAGGWKKLAASPMLFWASCRWMNPMWEPPKKPAGEDHFDTGKGYHALLLEGREAFESRFAVALDRDAHPNALSTTDEIAAAFPDGIKPRGKNKKEKFEHLKTLDGSVEYWPDLQEEHAARHPGKTFISAKTYQQLLIAGTMVEKNPEIAPLLKGGWPEVSLFWICPKTGVPKKARVDYMKIRAMVDVKTVSNTKEQSIENVIRFEIANRRYVVQPSHYFEGASEVRKIVRERGAEAIHGTPEQIEWAGKWASHQAPDEWFWLFIQKGVAPIIRGVHYLRGGTTKMLADDICNRMSRTFRQFAETMGTDPWVDAKGIYDIQDDDLPPWSVEI